MLCQWKSTQNAHEGGIFICFLCTVVSHNISRNQRETDKESRIKNGRTRSPPGHDCGHELFVMFASITNAARLAKQQRVIHTGAPGSTFIGDLTSVLAQRQPCFAVSPADVDVLSSPQQFYGALLVGIGLYVCTSD